MDIFSLARGKKLNFFLEIKESKFLKFLKISLSSISKKSKLLDSANCIPRFRPIPGPLRFFLVLRFF